MQRKGLCLGLSSVLVMSFIAPAYPKEINRYIMLHKNRKNEAVVEPSPLGSGYDQTTAVEFQFRQNSSEAMKRRVRMVFPLVEEPDEDEDFDEASEIFGKSGKYSFGDNDTSLEELEEETLRAIENQEKAEELKLAEQRKQNVASYAASVAAKIKREKEAALTAALGINEEEEPLWEESYGPTDEVEEEYDENSIVLVTDSSGKIVRKQKQKEVIASGTASATTPLASDTIPVASGTAPAVPGKK